MNIDESHGVKALVVDSHIDICVLLSLVLEQVEIETTYVTSAQEALVIYKLLKPDILIADLDLPRENGFSLIRTIRALKPEEGGQVPAIAVTGYTFEDVGLEVVEAGFQGFISKPFDVHQLLSTVTGLLKPIALSTSNHC